MWLQARDIVAVEQPVQLLGGECDDLLTGLARPVKARFLQALLPQAKAIRLPIEHLNLVASAVAKNVELFCEGVHSQSVFHQDSQAIDAAAEVDWIPTEIHCRDVIGGPHHGRATAVLRTSARVAASTLPPNEMARPLGNWTCHWVSPTGLPATT